MPELPDIVVYLDALERRLLGRALRKVRIAGISLLKSVDPTPAAFVGKIVRGFRRLGKRIVFEFDDDLFCVLHLMIAGRLFWKPVGQKIAAKVGLAAFDFDDGTLLLNEASTKKRASLWFVRGEEALKSHDRGGLEPLDADLSSFTRVVRSENHTLKRALTDPDLFSGIGNAYSDEILFAARMSPTQLTKNLDDDAIARLFAATKDSLRHWIETLKSDCGDRFPEKVTAFRPGMAVHGRFGEPCPACGAPIQRILYAENESNYCAPCQTAGKLLADRGLSRLMKSDWPKTLEEMEARMRDLRQT